MRRRRRASRAISSTKSWIRRSPGSPRSPSRRARSLFRPGTARSATASSRSTRSDRKDSRRRRYGSTRATRAFSRGSGTNRPARMSIRMRMKTETLLITLLVVGNALSQETKGPLAGLPSAAGPHLEKIRALGDNSWLELGAPAPDPQWGRACGRSWTTLMPYAPELQGAFLFGEGVHGHTKPNGRYMDDLWFYDLRGHRWMCCYPGSDTKTLDLKISGDGLDVNAEGEPI